MSENVNADNSTNQVQPDVSQVNVADNSAPPVRLTGWHSL